MTSYRSLYLGLTCVRCGAEHDDGPLFEGCPSCRDGEWAANLVPTYDTSRAAEGWRRREGRGVWRYSAFLPVRDAVARTSMGEGETPLIDITPVASGFGRVWLKNEALNPTWSYKDRLCSVAVSKGREFGSLVIAASSTGNHGASAAAYAAAAGLRSVVLTREDVDRHTTAFMQAYGAAVIRTTRRGRWTLLAHGVHALGWYPVSTYTPAPTGNPFGADGYKSVAFEIFEDLGHVPEVLVVPTSYGEGLAGIWSGFTTLREIGQVEAIPRMVAVEPAGGAPLAHALELELDRVAEVGSPQTVATSIGSSIATDRALVTLRQSRGSAVRVSDEAILAAQQVLARRGIFLEPAGAAGLAALETLGDSLPGLPTSPEVVVIGTAGGLRQLDAARPQMAEPPLVEPDPSRLEEYVRRANAASERG